MDFMVKESDLVLFMMAKLHGLDWEKVADTLKCRCSYYRLKNLD